MTGTEQYKSEDTQSFLFKRMKPVVHIMIVLPCLLVWFKPVTAATIMVTSTADTVTTGCTLRLAILAANSDSSVGECTAGSGPDQLNFSGAGTVRLVASLPSITEEIFINGFSTAGTVIDGGGEHRIFEINAQQVPTELAVSRISNLTLTRGFSGALDIRIGNDVEVVNTTIINNISRSGAGISLQNRRSDSLGVRLTLVSSNIESNTATGPAGGGGIRAGIGSNVSISSSSIVRNRVTHPNGRGGGMALVGGGPNRIASSAIVTNSTISSNAANQDGGGISVSGRGTSLEIVSSTIASNVANADLAGVPRGSGGGLRIDPATSITLQRSIIAGNIQGFSLDDINVPGSALPPSVISRGFNLIGTNRSVIDYFSAGRPNRSKDFVGTTDSPLNTAAMLGPLAFDENSQTNYRPLGSTSLALNNAGQCGLEVDQLQRTRGVCECDIGAYEFVGLSPESTNCQTNFFVVPLVNGKSVIFEL